MKATNQAATPTHSTTLADLMLMGAKVTFASGRSMLADGREFEFTVKPHPETPA